MAEICSIKSCSEASDFCCLEWELCKKHYETYVQGGELIFKDNYQNLMSTKEIETVINEVYKEEPKNHDSHYSKQAIEPQSVIEQVARNIHDKVTPEQAINILQSLKYMLRLGTKDDVLKEVSKSVNYQTRALTGEWRK